MINDLAWIVRFHYTPSHVTNSPLCSHFLLLSAAEWTCNRWHTEPVEPPLAMFQAHLVSENQQQCQQLTLHSI